MIRIIDTRGLVVFGALFAALGLSACTQNVGDEVLQKDDEIRHARIVDVSGSATDNRRSADSIDVPDNMAHPMTRLGPHPEPWNDDQGPHPEPWRGGSDDGSGNGNGSSSGGSSSGKPGDPSNPNQ